MKKYIIQFKNDIIIRQVECEIVSILEDPSVMWLPKGEVKYKILSLKDKNASPYCYGFSIFDSIEKAKEKCISIIKEGFEFECRKYNTAFTQEDIDKAINSIQYLI